jgi:tryptophanyl-tRNA synthetase
MSRINLSDDADAIAKKFRKARTDPEPLPSEEAGFEGRPEAENLVGIYAALSGKTKPQVLADVGGSQFSQFKQTLTELAVEKLGPVASEMRRLMDDPAHIDKVLGRGAERAHALADPILSQVKDVVGYIQRSE